MADTTVTRYPDTPAEVASAVLDAIEQRPDTFAMNDWAWFHDAGELPPNAAPECGTTLCAAGWAAHVSGWTIVCLDADNLAEVRVCEPDGTQRTTQAQVFAQKGDERRLIPQAAAEALGLKPRESFWYVNEKEAVKRLRAIAKR
ncbi:hypothetical protein ACH41H_36345 [Streptomyces sp. NPDC020800]|uniref:hypothetical protein n=1 Tax=Streptomyces sp. NPDC020800 TaxID=3365092 RepID=UPI0037B7217E